ncbi:MAG: arginine repressor [Thermoleophilia bacterium]
MRKRERQQLIETLVKQKPLSRQEELVAALNGFGCRVTQATVSRDIRELGLQKGTDRNGRVRYVVPPPRVRRDPQEVLLRVLRESSATVQSAQNLVVIKAEPGTAPTIGRVLDELEESDVVGTVAGDDTVLMVMPDATSARRMTEFLETRIEPELK